MSTSVAGIAPPSENIINLQIADLAIYVALFFPAVWITWKHGKPGMVCWPIFLSYFVLRFSADIYQILHRNDPNIPNAAAIMTNAGSLACISLTLIGMVYEINITLPHKQRWTEKIILGVTHISNTTGIAIATYGGAPAATESGVLNKTLSQIGNCIMLAVMLYLLYWLWPTWKRMVEVRHHSKFPPTRFMLIGCAVGIPFHLVRLAYNTCYAFYHKASLDPVTGSFATRVVLIFLMQLGASLAITAGGWLGMSDRFPADRQPVEQVPLQDIEGVYRSADSTTNLSGSISGIGKR